MNIINKLGLTIGVLVIGFNSTIGAIGGARLHQTELASISFALIIISAFLILFSE